VEFCRCRASLFLLLLLLFSKSPVIYFESRRKIKLKRKKNSRKNPKKKKPADWILCRHINTSARRSVNDNSFRRPESPRRRSPRDPSGLYFYFLFFSVSDSTRQSTEIVSENLGADKRTARRPYITHCLASAPHRRRRRRRLRRRPPSRSLHHRNLRPSQP